MKHRIFQQWGLSISCSFPRLPVSLDQCHRGILQPGKFRRQAAGSPEEIDEALHPDDRPTGQEGHRRHCPRQGRVCGQELDQGRSWAEACLGMHLISPAWISNYIHYKVWDEITYPFPNFNSATVEVWEWISYFIPNFIGRVIVYPSWD